MVRATYKDKALVVDILKTSFDSNKSVNYLIPQDNTRGERLERFMEYSFDVCYNFGNVFLSDDRKGCALILQPDKKKAIFQSILLDLKFIFRAIGISNIRKAMGRENKIKSQHPDGLLYYVWFIGVESREQNKGIGSKLLREVIKEGKTQNRVICLETSTTKNLPWYQKFGFSIYNEMDFGYTLYCMKKE